MEKRTNVINSNFIFLVTNEKESRTYTVDKNGSYYGNKEKDVDDVRPLTKLEKVLK